LPNIPPETWKADPRGLSPRGVRLDEDKSYEDPEAFDDLFTEPKPKPESREESGEESGDDDDPARPGGGIRYPTTNVQLVAIEKLATALKNLKKGPQKIRKMWAEVNKWGTYTAAVQDFRKQTLSAAIQWRNAGENRQDLFELMGFEDPPTMSRFADQNEANGDMLGGSGSEGDSNEDSGGGGDNSETSPLPGQPEINELIGSLSFPARPPPERPDPLNTLQTAIVRWGNDGIFQDVKDLIDEELADPEDDPETMRLYTEALMKYPSEEALQYGGILARKILELEAPQPQNVPIAGVVVAGRVITPQARPSPRDSAGLIQRVISPSGWDFLPPPKPDSRPPNPQPTIQKPPNHTNPSPGTSTQPPSSSERVPPVSEEEKEEEEKEEEEKEEEEKEEEEKITEANPGSRSPNPRLPNSQSEKRTPMDTTRKRRMAMDILAEANKDVQAEEAKRQTGRAAYKSEQKD
jgi:hypothetical protein